MAWTKARVDADAMRSTKDIGFARRFSRASRMHRVASETGPVLGGDDVPHAGDVRAREQHPLRQCGHCGRTGRQDFQMVNKLRAIWANTCSKFDRRGPFGGKAVARVVGDWRLPAVGLAILNRDDSGAQM